MVAVRTSVCLWNIPLFTITFVKIRKFNLFSYKIFVSVRDQELLILEPTGPVILELYAICLSMCLSVSGRECSSVTIYFPYAVAYENL
jgi:hypothetical protein